MPRNRRLRAQQFSSDAARALYAAICTLDAASQRDVLEAISDHLALAALGLHHTASSRVRRGITALRDVADACGGSPSVGDYRRVRLERPELDLPPDGSLRRWLGAGSWNDCLRTAHLDGVEEGEVVMYSLGTSLSTEELAAAIRACASEVGGRPSLSRYIGWARRHDVRSRFDRLPTSGASFTRTFGSWGAAATFALSEHADGVNDGDAYTCVDDGRLLPRKGTYEPSDYEAAIREVTTRLGREPSIDAYKTERLAILREASRSGRARAFPSAPAIYNRYARWANALASAREPSTDEATVSRDAT